MNGLRRILRTSAAGVRAVGELIVTYLPGRPGNTLRTRYYRRRLKGMGEGVRIEVGVHILNPEYVSLGNNVFLDRFVVILAGPPHQGKRRLFSKPNPLYEHDPGELVIGDSCHIAPYVVINAHGGVSIGANSGVAAGSKIYSLSHDHQNAADATDTRAYSGTSMAREEDQSLVCAPIVMEENTMLGLNSVILPGATVRRDTWVGPGSLVHLALPAGVIAMGSPARVLQKRNIATDGHGEAHDK